MPNDAAVQQLMRTKSLRLNLSLPRIFIHLSRAARRGCASQLLPG